MKATGQLEKWGSGVLGAVCVALLLRLVLQFSNPPVGAARPGLQVGRASPPRALRRVKVPAREEKELARYDPVLKVDLLKTLAARPLPKFDRNPFQFQTAPVAEQQKVQGGPSAAAPAPVAPPPPPPIPLKAMGYSEKPGNVREGLVTDEEQIYVVHEGETFAQRYKVLKITPAAIDIEDESTHQTVQLPFAQ